MESNHARTVPARFSLGRRSFPIMLFRRALKHLLSMTKLRRHRSEPPGPARRSADAGSALLALCVASGSATKSRMFYAM